MANGIPPKLPNLLIRRYPCWRPDPSRSVRDLGRVPDRCPSEFGEPEGRSSVWLRAWLPAARELGALVLVTIIGLPWRLHRLTVFKPGALEPSRGY
jgi:hypothetical protein